MSLKIVLLLRPTFKQSLAVAIAAIKHHKVKFMRFSTLNATPLLLNSLKPKKNECRRQTGPRKIKKISYAKTIIIAVIFTPVSAFAQNPGLYLGLGMNRASTHVNPITVDNQPISDIISGTAARFSSTTGSAGATTWMLYGGYRLNRFLAVEVLYAALGEYARSASGVGRILPGKRILPYMTVDNLTLDGFGLTGVAGYPINDHWYLFGKFGMFHWTGKLTHTTSFTTVGLPKDNVYSNEKDSGASPILGIGVQYNFVHAISGIFQWMTIDKVGGNLSTGEDKVNIYSIGAQIHF